MRVKTTVKTGTGRKSAGVDPDLKEANLRRLNRVEGQIRGIRRMVEEERYCADILGQIAAAQEALRAVGRELLRNHLRHCVARASARGGAEAEEAYDEVVDLFYKNTK